MHGFLFAWRLSKDIFTYRRVSPKLAASKSAVCRRAVFHKLPLAVLASDLGRRCC